MTSMKKRFLDILPAWIGGIATGGLLFAATGEQWCLWVGILSALAVSCILMFVKDQH